MYQLNPLLESKAKLLRRLSRYTPEEVAKIRERMIQLGKENGGWYNASEYGKRMTRGQAKRLHNTARKYNRDISIHADDSVAKGNAETIFSRSGQYDKIAVNPDAISIPSISKSKKRLTKRKDLRKLLRDPNEHNLFLTTGDTMAHEADEYSIGNALKQKLGLPKFNGFDDVQSKSSSHFPGVLRRERKRQHLLSQLYGRDANQLYVREKEQVVKNEFKHVFNQLDSIRHIYNNTTNPLVKEKYFRKYLDTLYKHIKYTENYLRSNGFSNKELSTRSLIQQYIKNKKNPNITTPISNLPESIYNKKSNQLETKDHLIYNLVTMREELFKLQHQDKSKIKTIMDRLLGKLKGNLM